jgi:hypothetical protein
MSSHLPHSDMLTHYFSSSVSVRMHTCVCEWVRMCVHEHVCVCISVRECVCVRIRIRVRMSVRVCVCAVMRA